jgi:2-hydroxychromene-2-carboxylate isomerase
VAAEPETSVDFFFDPICPWAYQTSLWIREVRRLTGLEVTWRFFSLEEINRPDGKRHPWERPWAWGWSLLRVAALLRRESQDACDRWYAEVGRALHEQGRAVFLREEAEALAAEIGFGADVVARAVDDPTTADEVQADHDEAVATYAAFGVPTLVIAGRALFGPTVVPAPTGDEALRLWRVVTEMSSITGLYEIQHPKTPDDLAAVQQRFAPYLTARRWPTITNPTP